MRFQTPLIPARLLRRYKRFLADVVLADGQEVTAHCPNPGSMMGLCEPGTRVFVEPNTDPRKKLKYAWRLVDHENGHMTGIDTGAANKIVKEALEGRKIPLLDRYDTLRSEVKYGTQSRVDFLLREQGQKDIYLEVKSVTLMREKGLAEFPDSVTARGLKHLQELARVVEEGHRGMLLFLIQRSDCQLCDIARDIDPAYARGLEEALARGIEILCMSCHLSEDIIAVDKPIPFGL